MTHAAGRHEPQASKESEIENRPPRQAGGREPARVHAADARGADRSGRAVRAIRRGREGSRPAHAGKRTGVRRERRARLPEGKDCRPEKDKTEAGAVAQVIYSAEAFSDFERILDFLRET